jgi:hypothetical protein
MHVIGHEHIAYQRELILAADLAQHFRKEIFGVSGLQVRMAMVTAERQEMQVLLTVAALESLGHGAKNGVTHPLQTAQRAGHPRDDTLQ